MTDKKEEMHPSVVLEEDQFNRPTFVNAQEFVHSLFGSKTNLQVRSFQVVPISRGFRIEIDVRRKKSKSTKKVKVLGKPD